VTKSNALETLVIAGFVRSLSVRDVGATLADALGAEAASPRSAPPPYPPAVVTLR